MKKSKKNTPAKRTLTAPAPPTQGAKNPTPIFMRPLIQLSPEMQEAFLTAISNGNKHATALKQLELNWRSVSLYMTTDPAFKARYDEAMAMRQELLDILREEEADHRAIVGWNEPVFQNGVQVGVIRRFSDKLMELRLKATNPAKYAERYEHTGAGGGPVAVVQMVGGPARPATIVEWERQVRQLKDDER
jgi:hypothetical protein